MKSERGITLVILVIYILMFSVVMGLLATLSNYIYSNLYYVNDNSIDVSEFNKFNMYFIEDTKTNNQAEIKEITNSEGKNILQITFSDGDIYSYSKEEKCIYKNKQKIAKNIQSFRAEQYKTENGNKKYITIDIKIGANEEANYTQSISYVLKYW